MIGISSNGKTWLTSRSQVHKEIQCMALVLALVREEDEEALLLVYLWIIST